MITAIRSTSRSIAAYLQAQLAADPDLAGEFGPAGTSKVYLDSPAGMGTQHGLSVWLYQVLRDEFSLNAPPRMVSSTQQRKALPLRLHYLLTPFGKTGEGIDAPETEQVILAKVLHALHERPTLRGVHLADDFAGTDTEVTTRFEPLTIDQLARVWDALRTAYRTSVAIEASVVDVYTVPEDLGPAVRIPLLATGVEVG